MSVHRVHGPYQAGRQWRVITKNTDGTRSTRLYKTREEAVTAMQVADRAVSAGVGAGALVAGLLAQAVPLPADPAWVYLLRDDTGAVIYVGVTQEPSRRLETHAIDGRMYASAAMIPSPLPRHLALEIERMLVRVLRPKLNYQHNTLPGERRPRGTRRGVSSSMLGSPTRK